MKPEDFKNINYFTQKEIEQTGAKIEDVDLSTLSSLDDLREFLGIPTHLMFNGVTTGNHKSEGHPKGKAIDCHMREYPYYYKVFQAALKFGFNKIGIYFNGSIYSYHLEKSFVPAFWTGVKKPAMKHWEYGPLIIDPKDL